MLRRDEMMPRESVPQRRPRPRLYLRRAREPRGPQIFLSRTHPQFMAKLFAQEVPEIYDGIIEIKAVARDPGSRAKIAVISPRQLDRSGRRLRRHARLARAGRGQRAAGREDRHHSLVARSRHLRRQRAGAGRSRQGGARRGSERIEVVVPDEQLSLAIGRRGQNVRLASQLTGWDIDILTEQEESERRQAEFENAPMFMDSLDVDEGASEDRLDRRAGGRGRSSGRRAGRR
jgi:transcription termination/antitermination protein NusA